MRSRPTTLAKNSTEPRDIDAVRRPQIATLLADFLVFTALHGMQMRGLEMRLLIVCTSVRPSVKRVHCDKTEKRSVQIFIPYDSSFSLVL